MKPSLVVRIKDFVKFKLIAFYKLIVPSFVKKHWIEEHEKQIDVFYSQQGEDIILHRMFEWQEQGFYIDVGAHHPTRFSNTYKFYKRGWTGINVDAMPGSMTAFNRLRPKDINIELDRDHQFFNLIVDPINRQLTAMKLNSLDVYLNRSIPIVKISTKKNTIEE